MDTGTDVYFVWDGAKIATQLNEDISSLLISEGFKKTGASNYWTHQILGNVAITSLESGGDHTSLCLSFDCELLPDLNDPGFERPQSPPIEIYHLSQRIFSALDVDKCFAATQSDGVSYFNFGDPLISRIFAFSKKGPQKLVRPYEEKRPVSFTDVARDTITGEPNWVLNLDGPLRSRPIK